MNYTIYEDGPSGREEWFQAKFLIDAERICSTWEMTGEVVDNNTGEIVRIYFKGVQTYPSGRAVC